MSIIRRAKEFGIIGSYLLFLIGTYLFAWEALTIFLAYFLEFIAVLLLYTLVRFFDERKRPERYAKLPPVMNIFIGAIPLLLLQYFILVFNAGVVNPEANISVNKDYFFTMEVAYMLFLILIVYLLKIISLKDNLEREAVLKENVLFQALAISLANIIGLLVVAIAGKPSLMVVLIGMTIIRVLLEFLFNRRIRLI